MVLGLLIPYSFFLCLWSLFRHSALSSHIQKILYVYFVTLGGWQLMKCYSCDTKLWLLFYLIFFALKSNEIGPRVQFRVLLLAETETIYSFQIYVQTFELIQRKHWINSFENSVRILISVKLDNGLQNIFRISMNLNWRHWWESFCF